LSSESTESEGTEEGVNEEARTEQAMPPTDTDEVTAQETEAEVATLAGPKVEGRRTQLRILRENIQSLSKDVGNFRKSHEGSTKRLEKQVVSLRKELATHTRSKHGGDFSKSVEAGTKRLQKEVATLRNELAALKSNITRDAARSRAKQEAMLSKILAKVSKSPRPARRKKKR
jgi:prefoldin subunit 5